jgi:hypothetical protein
MFYAIHCKVFALLFVRLQLSNRNKIKLKNYFSYCYELNIWLRFKKYVIINICQSGNKVLLLDYEHKNNPLLSRLPKCKHKEKWQKIMHKAKFFVQKLWSSVYWKPRIELQRLPLDKGPLIKEVMLG